MGNNVELPTLGYLLKRVILQRLVYRILTEEEAGAVAESRSLTLNWDCRATSEGDFEIRLGVVVGPQARVFERIIVDYVGRFAFVGEELSVDFVHFVKGAGPAILLPYLREAIANASSRGPYGTYHLPILNVLKLMDGMDISRTTAAKQLLADLQLLEKFKTSRESLSPVHPEGNESVVGSEPEALLEEDDSLL